MEPPLPQFSCTNADGWKSVQIAQILMGGILFKLHKYWWKSLEISQMLMEICSKCTNNNGNLFKLHKYWWKSIQITQIFMKICGYCTICGKQTNRTFNPSCVWIESLRRIQAGDSKSNRRFCSAVLMKTCQGWKKMVRSDDCKVWLWVN